MAPSVASEAYAYQSAWVALIPAARAAVEDGDAEAWGRVLRTGFSLLEAFLRAFGVEPRATQLEAWHAPLPPSPDLGEARLLELRGLWETEQALPEGSVPDRFADPMFPAAPEAEEDWGVWLEDLCAELEADAKDDVSRETSQSSSDDDAKTAANPPRTLGWMRVPVGAETCGSCLMIASRAHRALTPPFDAEARQMLFNSRETAARACGHNGCDCLHIPLITGQPIGDDVKAAIAGAWDVYEAGKDAVTREDIEGAYDRQRTAQVASRAAAQAVRDARCIPAFQKMSPEEQKAALKRVAERAAQEANTSTKRMRRASQAALVRRMNEVASSSSYQGLPSTSPRLQASGD